MPLPDAIANAPTLAPGLALYLQAWNELGTCRPPGDRMRAIPWHEVNRWAEAHSLTSVQTEALKEHVRELDRVFLDWVDK